MKHAGGREIGLQGLKAGWPICLGYVPIGMAFGVLAQKSGLSPQEIGLMSLLVFAGSSQFIAVSMLSSGAAHSAIILTTFVVNLRHFLMSSALAVSLGRQSRLKLSLFSYGVTDESFAVNLARLQVGGWDLHRSLVVNHCANFAWIVSTVAGGLGGQYIPADAFGIDYALNAMFICLLIYQLRDRATVLVAIVSGGLAVGLAVLIPGNSYIVLAAVIAATIGVVVKRQWWGGSEASAGLKSDRDDSDDD